MTHNKTTIVLVGHCGPDAYAITHAVTRALGSVQIVHAMARDQLLPHLRPGTLWLVNRVLDGDFDADDGIDLIRQITGQGGGPAMMLVSNYAAAQQQALAVGAVPGFGKAQLHLPLVAQCLRDAAGLPPA